MDHVLCVFFAQTESPARVLIGRRMHRSHSFGFQALASLAFFLMAICGLAGCSSGSAKTPSSQTPLISVMLKQLPPTTMPVSGSAQVSATVLNDPANAGVDWAATCGSTSAICGSFSPTHTASGAATTFTAPLGVPPQTTVSVTALSTTDHSKSAASSVSIYSYVTNVTITQWPPATAPAGSAITVSATVAGDPASLGVDWKANCGGVDCTPSGGLHSASGAPLNFVIPSTFQIPTIVGNIVRLTAYATADHSQSAYASFVVAPPILVTITQIPPSTMFTNATATVIAVVQNDPTNSGVNWSVSCATAPCGTVVPPHTASGAPAVFTAPPVVPGSIQNPNTAVTIIAQSAVSASSTIEVGVTIVAPITVQLTQIVPNNTIVQGSSVPLVATISNDTANAGVDWTVTCGSPGSCGSFSPAHTVSAASTLYTAPAAIPAGGTVTITAASRTDPTSTAMQTVTVTATPPPNSLLTGRFVMLLSSNYSANGAYVLGGVISGDGNGTITTGTADLVDDSGNSLQGIYLASSTYSIGPEGQGEIQIQISPGQLNAAFGVNGTGALTLSVVFVTPQHATLSESDSFGTATGTLDLQNPQGFSGALSPGVYTLNLSGSEQAHPSSGYFVESAVTIPSTAPYSYIADQSDGGAILSVPYTTSSVGFPNLVPYGAFYSLSSLNLGLPTQLNLHLWPIDGAHFVVTDVQDSYAGTPPVIVGGHFISQPSAPAISGTYAFTEAGAAAQGQPQAAGGILTCGSTGVVDVIPLSGTVLTNQAVNATCGVVTNGRSLIAVTGAASSGINQFAAYPTVDQGLFLIELDGGTSGTSGSSGGGLALQQTVPPPITSSTFNGSYASNFSASTVQGSQSFAANIAADGTSALSGTGDVNSLNAAGAPPVGTPSLGAGFSGSFTAASDGRFPLTLSITPANGQPAPQITNLDLACYVVNANTCMLLGLDAIAPGTGVLLLQNTGL